MERFLNIIHYIVYKIDYKVHLWSNKINPFILMYKLPIIKNRMKRKGYDNPVEEINKVFGDKEGGFSIKLAGGAVMAILFFIVLGLVFLVGIPFNYKIKGWQFFLFIPLVYYLDYRFVSKDDKYLEYFAEFEKKNRSWKVKWALITVFLMVASFFFWFQCMDLNYHSVN